MEQNDYRLKKGYNLVTFIFSMSKLDMPILWIWNVKGGHYRDLLLFSFEEGVFNTFNA